RQTTWLELGKVRAGDDPGARRPATRPSDDALRGMGEPSEPDPVGPWFLPPACRPGFLLRARGKKDPGAPDLPGPTPHARPAARGHPPADRRVRRHHRLTRPLPGRPA